MLINKTNYLIVYLILAKLLAASEVAVDEEKYGFFPVLLRNSPFILFD